MKITISDSYGSVLAVFALLVLTSALAPVALAQPADAVGGNQTTTATPTPTANESNSSTANQPAEPVPLAKQTRISPVKFGKDYIRTTQRDNANKYSVIGPVAVFASTHKVAAAEIKQPKASAKVLSGGQTVRVRFQSDAAGQKEYTLYELTLYFEDGSKRALKLYVRKTDQFVAPASLQSMNELRQVICEDAKSAGVEKCSISNLKSYYKNVYDTAQVLSNWLSPELKKAWMAIMFIFRSGLLMLFFAIVAIGTAVYIMRVHGDNIRKKVHDTHNAYVRRRRDYRNFYRDQRADASEEPLSSIDVIGASDTALKDGFGVSSVKELADLFAVGEPQRTPGNEFKRRVADGGDDMDIDPSDGPDIVPADIEMHHRGIHDLMESDSLLEEWPSEGLQRTPLTETEFLAYGKHALRRMAHHYGQEDYSEAYEMTRAKLNDLSSGSRTYDMEADA